VLPAAEGGSERQLLKKGERLVLLQTEEEVQAAERKREEGACFIVCVACVCARMRVGVICSRRMCVERGRRLAE
jgi:hypothetical protein